MIKLNEKKNSLLGIEKTIGALENIDGLIKIYSEPKPGPAYVTFEYFGSVGKNPSVQFERSIMITALRSQRENLVKALAKLGVDASEPTQ